MWSAPRPGEDDTSATSVPRHRRRHRRRASRNLNGRAVQVTPVMALPVSRILGRLAADVVYGQLTVPVSGLKRWPTSPGHLLISPRAPGIAARSGAVPLSSPPPLFH
jgi:hypothetical protein